MQTYDDAIVGDIRTAPLGTPWAAVFPGFDIEDEMDAPSDWDAGTVTFDPYV